MSSRKRSTRAAEASAPTRVSARFTQYLSRGAAAAATEAASASDEATPAPAASSPNEQLDAPPPAKKARSQRGATNNKEEDATPAEGKPAATAPKNDAAVAAASSSSASAAAPAASSSAVASSAAAAAGRALPSLLSFPDSLLRGPISAYASAFNGMARELMLRHELVCNGHRLRLLEIEFYWRANDDSSSAQASVQADADDANTPASAVAAASGAVMALVKPPASTDAAAAASDSSSSSSSASSAAAAAAAEPFEAHVDVFAHAHPIQKDNFGRWYFHRQGTKPDAAYKAGSYKGVDVTIGAENGGGHGGILIRSVQRISDGSIIEGPCLVAEEVLRLHGVDSINTLVQSWGGTLCAFSNPTLYFAPALHAAAVAPGQPVLLRSPRVGLTLKQSGATRPRYVMLPYRYTSLPFYNKKRKEMIVMSVYQELGPSQLDTICSLCDITKPALQRMIASYEAGRKLQSMDRFVREARQTPTVDSMAQMYGAWMTCFGPKPGQHVAILRA